MDNSSIQQPEQVTLVATVPPRADGTLVVDVPLGRGKFASYTFEEVPFMDETAMVCTTLAPTHAEWLQGRGNFVTTDEHADDLELKRRMAEREAKRAASQPVAKRADTFVPGDEDPEVVADPMAVPGEAKTKPTGRVRKAS